MLELAATKVLAAETVSARGMQQRLRRRCQKETGGPKGDVSGGSLASHQPVWPWEQATEDPYEAKISFSVVGEDGKELVVRSSRRLRRGRFGFEEASGQ